MDPSISVIGVTKESWKPGGTFSYGYEDQVESDGFMVSNVGYGVAAFPRLMQFPWHNVIHPRQYKHIFGTFVNIADDSEGQVFDDGIISKPETKEDRHKMSKGIDIAKKILIKAGCDSNPIVALRQGTGSYYCGTAALDRFVDRNLETRIRKLYVCDSGVFPRSPGRQHALAAIALGKWFARQQCATTTEAVIC